MSAAVQAVFVEAPVRLESHGKLQRSEEALGNLVHELRQPLSSIEAIAYYLEMTLPPEQFLARQYMHRIQQLVAEAGSTMKSAVSTNRKPSGTAGF